MEKDRERAILGCLAGTAVGDALGLPAEGISKRRQQRLWPDLAGHHFIFGRGMVSDDTEHTFLVGRALGVSGGEEKDFQRRLAWDLRWWLLTLPPGIGLATLRALIKLWLGFSPQRSGVFSAGNGPAMRSAILGAALGPGRAKLKALVGLSTRLTHIDPKAEYGAYAVALAAARAAQGFTGPDDFLAQLARDLGPGAAELLRLVEQAAASAARGQTTADFAADLGWKKGVGGYVYETVPAALQAWFLHPGSYEQAVLGAIRCGGDTDTVAAIVGGIVGAGSGLDGIKKEWLDRLWGWPVTLEKMKDLAGVVAAAQNGIASRPRSWLFPWLFLRNLYFTPLVLAHGFRRLAPPY
jgi:ADP-ribosylglycohydrolase